MHLIVIPTHWQSATIQQLQQTLSSSERRELQGISHAITRQSFVITRTLLRFLLADHSAIAPHTLAFSAGRYGKLTLTPSSDCQLHFNLSHCGYYSLLALSARYYVGIDLEQKRQIRYPKMLAAHLGHAGHALSTAQLLRCWCRSEAVIKAYGASIMQGTLGLPYRLTPYTATRWRCPLAAAARQTLQLPLFSPLHICDLPTKEGWYAALAARGHPLPPRLCYWTIQEEDIYRFIIKT